MVWNEIDQVTEFSEKCSLAYLAGYVLKKVINGKKKKFKCGNCAKLVITDLGDEQTVNSLISIKEYKEGAPVRPSTLANEMFDAA